jgi:DNA-binding beta-propeller fold protein YncE
MKSLRKTILSHTIVVVPLIFIFWLLVFCANSAAQDEYYTIMLGSYHSLDNAESDYETIRNSLVEDLLGTLRIEKNQQYYTLRLGKFTQKTSADGLLPAVRQKFKDARVLSAYYKPERIIKILSENANVSLAAEAVVSDAKRVESPPVYRPFAEGSRSVQPVKIKTIISRKYKVKIVDHINNFNKEADVATEGKEFFVVQVASFTDQKLALLEYENLRKAYHADQLPELRIERVHGYYTVRVGRFSGRQEAAKMATVIKKTSPHLVILQAYIIDSRIVMATGVEEKAEAAGEQTSKIIEKLSALSPLHTIVVVPLPVSDAPVQKNTAVEEKSEAPPDVILPVPAESLPIKPEIAEDQKTVILPVAPPKPDNATIQTKSITAVDKTSILNSDNAVLRDVFDDELKKTKFSYEIVDVIEKDDQGEKIKMPSSLFFDRQRDELYVINGVNNRVIVYGPDFFPQNSLGKGRGIDSPMGGYIATDGRLYITQAGIAGSRPRVTILNNAFMPEKEIFMGDMPDSKKFIPQKITKTNGKLYITGLHSKRILILKASGDFDKWFQVAIDKRGEYAFADMTNTPETTYIRDVKSDYLGNLFFLSEETSKVYVFNYKEDFLFSFGVKGGAEGKMSRPRGLAIDEEKHCVYVVDYMRHTVLIYDFTGKFRYEFGGRGWGAEWFNYPADIELGAQNNVIVADFFNQQVKVFTTHWQEKFPPRDPKQWQIVDEGKQ